jgi:hypothetical protein
MGTAHKESLNMATRMQQRRGTAAEWTTINPILAAGEIGFETDTGKFKIGDGVNAWSVLTSYGSIDSIIDAAPETLNTLNELAAAINDDPDFYNSITTSVTDAVATAGEYSDSLATNYDPAGSAATALADAKTYADTAIENIPAVDFTGYATETFTNTAVSDGIAALVDASPDALNTLNEISAALGDDPDFYTNVAASINSTFDTLNANVALARTDLTTAYEAADADEVTNRNGAISTALSTAGTNADTAIGVAIDLEVINRNLAIEAESGVISTAYNLADVAVSTSLETYATTKADAAQAAAESTASADATAKADAAELAAGVYSDSAISTHNLDTTSVHGIADTSVLATNTDVSNAQAAAEGYADGLAANYDATGTASTAQAAAQSFATTAVDNHSTDTTGVHGIADTSLLVTTAGATLLGKLTLDGDPTQALHAATKQYVDSSQAGLSTKPQVEAASTANVSGTYDNGTAGVGATLNLGQLATLDIDGVTSWSLLEGILLKDQTDASENGRWVVDQIGNGTDTDWILRRCSLCDTADEIPGAYIFVIDGTTNSQSGWVLHVDNPDTFTVGTDDIDAYQFAGAGAVTAGTNILVNGSEVSLSADPTLSDATITNLDITNLVFPDGTQTSVGVPSITTISSKTASYELASTSDRDTIVEVNNAGATTLTIPTDATVNFPVGTTLDVIQTGAGQVTIAGAGGVTVNATPGLKLRAQWSSVTLLKRAANSWVVFGDTAA